MTTAVKETLIRPNRSWLHINIQELIEYRDLLLLLVRRDFVSKYKQTVLGPAWAIIQPVLSSFGFLIIKVVLNTDTGSTPAFLFFMCGQLGWTYFASTLAGTGNTLRGNARVFGKVYFPRLISPLSTVVSGYIAFAIQLASFSVVYAVYYLHLDANVQPTPYLWMVPIFSLHMGLAALGVGLFLTSLTTKYRDLSMIQGFLVNIWMFATPILWPFSRVPEKWQWLAACNPMAMVVEGFKAGFLGESGFTWSYYGLSVAISVLVLLLGILAFQRVERTYIDTV